MFKYDEIKDKPLNPWTTQDEGDHFPVMKEWWTIETLFKTIEDNRKWNLISSFAYKLSDKTSFFQYVLFDITSGKYVVHKDVNDDIKKLLTTKNRIDIKFEKSYISGLYPNYNIHIEDEKQDFFADMKYTARSLPHWVAQNKTNGFLPIGLNYYRYGFLPNCDLTGTLQLNNKTFNIKGKGYIEHAYGNWSYENPFKKIHDLKKTISIYTKLGKWWLSQNKPHIPKSISLTTENNIFGYDWVWGVFDNEWSLFFGNSMFWVSEGPSFGSLYVSPDGYNYLEFCNVRFRYNKVIYIKEYDIYYPSEIELIGKLDDKRIQIKFSKSTDSYEYISPYENSKIYKAWILCEMPGRMTGLYSDKERTVNLEGDCKIVILRLPSSFGHNSIKFDFLLPPKGVGVDINFNSHYLKKEIFTKLHFAPKPSFGFKMKKTKRKDIL